MAAAALLPAESAAAEMAAAEGEAAASAAPEGKAEAGAPPEPLRAKLWRALADSGQVLRPKEMKEACAFYDAVRKDARRSAPSLVIDVCGGHGALGMLFVANGVAPKALVIDQLRPTSHQGLLRAWRPFLGDEAEPLSYDERPLQVALPEALAAHKGKCLVVACHACQHLAQDIIDCCIAARADFAVCPCCPKDEMGRVQAAAQALGVDFGVAMVLAEMGRLSSRCDVRLRTFDEAVSPQNRVLLGRVAADKAGGDSRLAAGAKLRSAYERAQRKRPEDSQANEACDARIAPGADPRRSAATSSSASSAAAASAAVPAAPAPAAALIDYEQQLHLKMDAVAAIMRPLVDANHLDGRLLTPPDRMEVRRSPAKHFRARTVVAIGESRAEAGEGLFRFISDGSGRLRLLATVPTDTLLPQIEASLPALAELLSEDDAGRTFQPGLRCIKLHATLGGKPPQLLFCLIYGPDGEAPTENALEDLRAALAGRLAGTYGAVEVVAMAQARGVQRCVPEGRDFVDERLAMAGRAEPLRYRQPFGQFSNPNPHVAIATAEWLSDVIRTNVGGEGGGPADLLELYCGAGSHTVALAPLFRHVLAVEINRHLVTAAERNIAQNSLENVTVVRAPSEEFCKRILRKRSYQIRGEDGSTKLQLHFSCTIVDPPRAGLDQLTLGAVAGYDHVLYVSCNPEALRRDLGTFLETHDVCRLVLLDHFPFSAHAEVAVHLRRRILSPGAGPES